MCSSSIFTVHSPSNPVTYLLFHRYLERQKAREERAAAAKEQEQQEGGAEERQQGDGQQGAAAGPGAERGGPSAPGAGADKGSKERDADAFDPEVSVSGWGGGETTSGSRERMWI